MNPKTYSLLDKCIEDGLNTAKRSIKNLEVDPTSEIAQSMTHDAIMKEIELWFDFETAHVTLSVQNVEHQ